MPKLWVKQAGTWKQVNQIYVKQGGVWKSPTYGIIIQNGVGKTFYPDTTAVTLTYNTPGVVNSFTVPAGVQRLNIITRGASGGTGGSYASGSTAYPGADSTAGQVVQGNLAVSPGQVLYFQVGGGGATGLQSWNAGTGGTAGSAYSTYTGAAGTTNANAGGGGGGGATVIYSSTGSVIVVAAGGAGGQGAPSATGGSGGSGGGSNTVPSGCSSSAATNQVSTTDNTQPSGTKYFTNYYNANYNNGGVGQLSGVYSALTTSPDYVSGAASAPYNNGNGGDFIITYVLKGGYGGFACYATQNSAGAVPGFVAPGNTLSIYAGKTVSGINYSNNGGSKFWLFGPDIYHNGNDGFLQISVVTNDRYPLVVSSLTNTTSISITPSTFSTSYVTGKTDVIYTVPAGVLVSGADTNTPAVTFSGFAAGDTLTINNSGTIAGAGGGYGSMQQNGSVNTTWANGNGPNCINTGYTTTGADGYGYGNYSGTIYYFGPGIGGNWPVYDSYSGGTGPANGGTGTNGGPAIALNCNNKLTINNNATGIITGGGGGAGGQAGNNRGGGQGGQGGSMLIYSGSHPAVVANNAAGGILAGGGGGAGGWGNRYEGEGHGGYFGSTAIGYFWTGAGASQGSGGQLSTNNATTLINSSSGTYVISPAA